jgi:hypothetical protein
MLPPPAAAAAAPAAASLAVGLPSSGREPRGCSDTGEGAHTAPVVCVVPALWVLLCPEVSPLAVGAALATAAAGVLSGSTPDDSAPEDDAALIGGSTVLL